MRKEFIVGIPYFKRVKRKPCKVPYGETFPGLTLRILPGYFGSILTCKFVTVAKFPFLGPFPEAAAAASPRILGLRLWFPGEFL